MLDKIKQLLMAPQGESVEKPAPELMAAALFIRLVSVDDDEDEREIAVLKEILAKRFELAAGDVEALVEQARTHDEQSVDLYGYTTILKQSYSRDECLGLVENMWALVLADGRIDPFEENMVWRVAELLGITSRERIEARQKVMQSLP